MAAVRFRRSPHGERGLKSASDYLTAAAVGMSLPARGAWIEIFPGYSRNPLPTSLPARGAWIEIEDVTGDTLVQNVAPRTGSVD